MMLNWERKFGEDEILPWWYVTKLSQQEIVQVKATAEDQIFNILKPRYERRIQRRESTIDQIEQSIYADAIMFNVEVRLLSMLDIWEKMYPFAVIKKDELQQLTNDEQNVHTRVVNKQTKKYMDIINAIKIPVGQNTTSEIVTAWMSVLGFDWATISPVYIDLLYWGKKSQIYEKEDFLYRKVLRSLWAVIKTYEGDVYKDLVQRLWQECGDSVGMCAHGHITRLANVLVGFSTSFLSPYSDMEVFQEKIASISQKDIDVKQKIAEALLIMDEIEMPVADREAWLEAF